MQHLERSKKWISEQLKGHTMANDCSEDEFYSSVTAYYEVYDGEPVVHNEYEPDFKTPVFVSDLFYTR